MKANKQKLKYYKLNKILSLLFPVLLGILLLTAGILKLININSLIIQIKAEYELGFFSLLVPVLILIEIYFGLNLVTLSNTKKIALSTFVLISFYTLFSLYVQIFHNGNSLYSGSSMKILSTGSLFLFYSTNIIMIAISYYIYHKGNKTTNLHILRTIQIIFIGVIFTTGFQLNNRLVSSVLKSYTPHTDKKTTENKNLNKKLHKDFNLDSSKTYMLFFFSKSCSYCLNSIENIKLYQEKKLVDSVILIQSELGKSDKINSKLNYYHDLEENNIQLKIIQPEIFGKYVRVYPTTLFIKNNKIQITHKGLMPAPLIFKKIYPEKLINPRTEQ